MQSTSNGPLGIFLLHGSAEVSVACEKDDTADAVFFDEGEESFHFADGFSIVAFATFGFVEDLRAVGDEFHRSGGGFEFDEEPVQLGFAPDAAGFRRGVVVFLRRVFVIVVVHEENLCWAVSKGAENAGRLGGAVGGITPNSPKREQGLFLERKSAVGIVGAVVVIIPNSVARNAAKHRLEMRMVACDQVAVDHAFQRHPISRLSRSLEVPIAVVANDEIGIVADEDHHVRLLFGNGLINGAGTKLRNFAARAEGNADFSRWGRRRHRAKGNRSGFHYGAIAGHFQLDGSLRCGSQRLKMQHLKPFRRATLSLLEKTPARPASRKRKRRGVLFEANPNPRFFGADMPNHRAGLQESWRRRDFKRQKRQCACRQKQKSKKSHKPKLVKSNINSKFRKYKNQSKSIHAKVSKSVFNPFSGG